MNKSKCEDIETDKTSMRNLKRAYHSPQLFALNAKEIQTGTQVPINEASHGALTSAS